MRGEKKTNAGKAAGATQQEFLVLIYDVRSIAADPFEYLSTVLGSVLCGTGTLGDHFGILGAPLEAMGAGERTPWGPESDLYRFWFDFGKPF
jgi:hypothetical protein